MRSEPPPHRDVCADLASISTAKNDPRRKRLRRLRPHIQKRFAEYWLARAALETVQRRPWRSPAEDAMEHCYTGSTIARTNVLEELFKQIQPDPNICPYCLMRQPKSLDHFLPKDFYPEFSVLAWNLVFVCDPCNRKKGNRFVAAPRQVINPYFDEMPATPLLHADVEADAGRITIRYRIDAGGGAVPAATVALMRSHYAALALENDYILEGSGVVTDIVNTITDRHRDPINQAQLDDVISERMSGWGNYPVNCFRLAVLEGLEMCEGFLGYVNERIATVPRPPRVRPPRDLAALRAAAWTRGSEL